MDCSSICMLFRSILLGFFINYGIKYGCLKNYCNYSNSRLGFAVLILFSLNKVADGSFKMGFIFR